MRRELVDLLHQQRTALALTQYYTMPGIEEMRQRLVDPVTADFLYVRFLGDRKQMEEQVEQLIESGTKKRHWNELVQDRSAEIECWAAHLKELMAQRPDLESYVFFNNHYAGYAPGSLEMFARAWKK